MRLFWKLATLTICTGIFMLCSAFSFSNDDVENLVVANDDTEVYQQKSLKRENGKMADGCVATSVGISSEQYVRIISGEVTGYVDPENVTVGYDAFEKICRQGILTAASSEPFVMYRENASVIYVDAEEEISVIGTLGEGLIAMNVDGKIGMFIPDENVTFSADLKTAVTIAEYNAEVRQNLVSYAKQWVGKTPYVYGGTSLKTGIDCSAFVRACYSNALGISLPRTSREQAVSSKGTVISRSDLQPGDLVFYSTNGTISHVAMYIGNGMIVHAANERSGVKISAMDYSTPCRFVSFLP